MGRLPHLIARALILWDWRVERRILDGSHAELRSKLPEHMYRSFVGEARSVARTDIDAAADIFLRDRPGLTEWYQALVEPTAQFIDWRDRQPLVHPRHVGDWEKLCSEFDPDALLTLDLAVRDPGVPADTAIRELSAWRSIPRVGDHELARMWRKGLSDLHIHVGGVRLPQFTWQELLRAEIDIVAFSELRRIYSNERRDIARDRDEAQTSWSKLCRHAEVDGIASNRMPAERSAWWRWSYRMLSRERCVLLSAWQTIIRRSPRRFGLVRDLDVYLSHKHRFFGLVRQRTFSSEPGLRHFSLRYFHALKSSSLRTREVPKLSYGMSPRLQMIPFGDACQYILESRDLRRVEFRITPFNSKNEYLKFFHMWDKLLNVLRRSYQELPDIRFAVHFYRSRKQGRRRAEPESDAKSKLLELDRQTAALRLALSTQNSRHQEWMSALARVDVAGQERDTPAALFATHLRLLRGDPEMLTFLENIGPDEGYWRWLERWRRLRDRGLHRPSLAAVRPGMTVHAGEDFADVLDGLYQVASAMESFGLTAGDGIGHALALTTPPTASEKRTKAHAMITVGADHDSVCWLYDLVRRQGDLETRMRYEQLLGLLVTRTAELVYRDSSVSARDATLEDHVWVWRNNFRRRSRPGPAKDVCIHLLNASQCDRVLLNREANIEVEEDRRRLAGLVEWAQRILMRELIARRVVIEMNPGSNLRISGAPSLSASPTVRLFRAVADGLLACINTDDPGIFMSCIENEYALLLEGAVDDGMNEGDARGLLERVRQIGNEVVYWPPRVRSWDDDCANQRRGPGRDRADCGTCMDDCDAPYLVDLPSRPAEI